jgi:hypothetical protein
MTTKTLIFLAGLVIAAGCLFALVANSSRTPTPSPVDGADIQTTPKFTAAPENSPTPFDSTAPASETATFALG